jgi:uncharacterized repeat protein (TIGR03803 family)
MQAADGYFYGTTLFGGDSSCTISNNQGCGTIFRIDSTGDFTAMHDFSGGVDGGVPFSSLIQAADGKFYGTATIGGNATCSVTAPDENFSQYNGCGTIFAMDSTGNVSTFYSFTGAPTDGSNPFSALLQTSNGTFYGVTRWGGSAPCGYTNDAGCGTIFSLSPLGTSGSQQQITSRRPASFAWHLTTKLSSVPGMPAWRPRHPWNHVGPPPTTGLH